MTDMNAGWMITALGLLSAGWYSLMFAVPTKSMEMLKKFPRDRISGIVLTACSLLWAALLLYNMPLGWFDNYKQWLYLIVPVVFFIIVKFMDQLLAPRALGALLLLIPAPILHGIRFNESTLRLVVVVLCYIMIIKGMILVMSPFHFRKQVERFIRNERICKFIGIAGLAVSVFLIVTGLLVFR